MGMYKTTMILLSRERERAKLIVGTLLCINSQLPIEQLQSSLYSRHLRFCNNTKKTRSTFKKSHRNMNRNSVNFEAGFWSFFSFLGPSIWVWMLNVECSCLFVDKWLWFPCQQFFSAMTSWLHQAQGQQAVTWTMWLSFPSELVLVCPTTQVSF